MKAAREKEKQIKLMIYYRIESKSVLDEIIWKITDDLL